MKMTVIDVYGDKMTFVGISEIDSHPVKDERYMMVSFKFKDGATWCGRVQQMWITE